MREIFFRGKVADEPDEWVFGYLVDKDAIKQTKPTEYSKCCGVGVFCVKPETVGQYTGLKDKNGTKIFEGDIVKLTRTNMYAPTTSFHNQDLISLHRVFWNSQKHCFYQEHFDIDKKRVTGGGILDFNDERAKQNIIEVVGNIYDNPELLEGERYE